MSGFVQMDPKPGEPATEQTEVWLSFDDDNFYRVGKRARQRHGAAGRHRDAARQHRIFQGNDIVSFMLDPFYDRRNALGLHHQPDRRPHRLAGDQRAAVQPGLEPGVDGQDRPLRERLDGGSRHSRSSRSATARAATRCGASTSCASSGRRTSGRSLTRVPPGRGNAAMAQTSFAATMVGLEAPPSGRALDIKPYATSSLNTNPPRPGLVQRPHGGGRAGHEVRGHAGADGRLHREDRFRAGGGRRAAGEPDPVQPVLPRKARVLPREPGDVRLRRRAAWQQLHQPTRTTPRRSCSTAAASG